MKRVTKITTGNHYLIHVFYKDLSSRDVHAYSYQMLNQKVNEILNDQTVYDFYIYVGIDFDLIDDPFADIPSEREIEQ